MPSTSLITTMPLRSGVINDMDVEASVWVADEVIHALAKALAEAAAPYGISPGELGLSIHVDKMPVAFARMRGEHEMQIAETRAREPLVVSTQSRPEPMRTDPPSVVQIVAAELGLEIGARVRLHNEVIFNGHVYNGGTRGTIVEIEEDYLTMRVDSPDERCSHCDGKPYIEWAAPEEIDDLRERRTLEVIP